MDAKDAGGMGISRKYNLTGQLIKYSA